MKTIIQRYLGSKFILPFFMSCFFFVFFLLTFQLFKVTKLVINKGVAISTVFLLLGHIAISFLPMAVPLSALFASIYALNKLSADSEFLSMRSFGFSKLKLFSPFLILSLMMALMIFSLNQSLIPYSQREFKRMVTILTSKGVLADIKQGQFYTEIPNVTIFAEDVKDEGKSLFDVFIHVKDKNEKEDKVIFAKEGRLIKKGLGILNEDSSLRLILMDGNIIKNFQGEENLEKILFKEYEFPISTNSMKTNFVAKDSMRTTKELYRILRDDPALRNPNNSRQDFIKIELEFWSRLNTPIQCIVFILLGFSLGVQKSRGKNQNSGTLCFVAVIIYYSIFFTGVSLAKSDNIPSWFAVFFPTFLTSILACKLYSRLEWVA